MGAPEITCHPTNDFLMCIFFEHNCLNGLVNECTMHRFLEIEDKAWTGLEETSACSPVSHHVGGVRCFFHPNALSFFFLLSFVMF